MENESKLTRELEFANAFGCVGLLGFILLILYLSAERVWGLL